MSVNITGGDHFLHPGLLVNDYSFPQLARVTDVAEPHHTTAAVDACESGNGGTVCDPVNNAFGVSQGPPADGQTDDGRSNTTEGASDTAAIANGGNTLPPSFPALLVEDLDTASTASAAGYASIIAAGQGPTVRTVTAPTKPGVYRYMCTPHSRMQGTIIVTP